MKNIIIYVLILATSLILTANKSNAQEFIDYNISFDNILEMLNDGPKIESLVLSSDKLVADGEKEYSLTLTVSDTDGVEDIRSLRIIFNVDQVNKKLARGYLSWGRDIEDIRKYGGYWEIVELNEGYSAFLEDDFGSEYITPLLTTVSTFSNELKVTWRFRVNKSWGEDGPYKNNYIGIFAEDGISNTDWQMSYLLFDQFFQVEKVENIK